MEPTTIHYVMLGIFVFLITLFSAAIFFMDRVRDGSKTVFAFSLGGTLLAFFFYVSILPPMN